MMECFAREDAVHCVQATCTQARHGMLHHMIGSDADHMAEFAINGQLKVTNAHDIMRGAWLLPAQDTAACSEHAPVVLALTV